MGSLGLFIIIIFTTLDVVKVSEGRSEPFLENNQLSFFSSVHERSTPKNPICDPDSICAYLQVNARGINEQKMCGCPNSKCSTLWDPFDGRSVTQGSDQYKFCGKSPEVSLCEREIEAYTSKTVFSKRTGDKISQIDHIFCICPDSHNYQIANQEFEDLDLETEIMKVSYICEPLKACGVNEICKIVSETSANYLVNRKCKCTNGNKCPTISDYTESFSFGSGVIHPVRCQN